MSVSESLLFPFHEQVLDEQQLRYIGDGGDLILEDWLLNHTHLAGDWIDEFNISHCGGNLTTGAGSNGGIGPYFTLGASGDERFHFGGWPQVVCYLGPSHPFDQTLLEGCC